MQVQAPVPARPGGSMRLKEWVEDLAEEGRERLSFAANVVRSQPICRLLWDIR